MAVSIVNTDNWDIGGVSVDEGGYLYDTNRDIGTASSDRIIVFTIYLENDPITLGTAHIDVGSGYVQMNAAQAQQTFGNMHVRQYWLPVPTGTTASSIKVYCTHEVGEITSTTRHATLHAVTGAKTSALYSSGGDGSTDMDSTDPLTTGSITIPSGGAFLGCMARANSSGSQTWSNATEELGTSTNPGSFRFGTAISTTAGSTTITCTGANNEDGVLAWLIFESGSQALTPSLFSDGDTFYSATVGRGAVGLTPSLYDNADTFHSATVGRGAVGLTPSLFSDGDTFYSPTVALGDVFLEPNLFSDGDTFHSATVTPGAVTLTPSLFSDADTFYEHRCAGDILPPLFVDGDTFHSAAVSPGAVGLEPELFTDADTFHSPSVIQGALSPALFSDADTFYSATVTRGAVALTPGLYANPGTFYTPTASTSNALTAALYSDADTFYGASISVGAQTLSPVRFDNSQAFFDASVSPPEAMFPHSQAITYLE